jgi:hypothetical protein
LFFYPDGNLTWRESIGQSKGYLYDSTHDFWTDNSANSFKETIGLVSIPSPNDTIKNGFIGMSSQGWGSDPPPSPPSNSALLSWDTTCLEYRNNIKAISSLADTLRNRRIHWIIINFPVSPLYKFTPAYCFQGPSWETADAIIKKMRELEDLNPYFHFYDAYAYGVNDYEHDDAYDELHLSAKGAAKLSVRVDSIIHTIFP